LQQYNPKLIGKEGGLTTPNTPSFLKLTMQQKLTFYQELSVIDLTNKDSSSDDEEQ